VTGNNQNMIFHDLGISGKVTKDRIPPKWSLVAPAAPKLILGGLRCLPRKRKNGKLKVGIWKSRNSQRGAQENHRDWYG